MSEGVAFVQFASSIREYTAAFGALKHIKRTQRRAVKHLDLLKPLIWNRN